MCLYRRRQWQCLGLGQRQQALLIERAEFRQHCAVGSVVNEFGTDTTRADIWHVWWLVVHIRYGTTALGNANRRLISSISEQRLQHHVDAIGFSLQNRPFI